MSDKSNNENLNSLIREALTNVSLPYSPDSWDEMDSLLDKAPKKYSFSLGDYSNYILGGALGLLLVGVATFLVLRTQGVEELNETQNETFLKATDTALTIVADTVKIQQAPLVQAVVDSAIIENTNKVKGEEEEEDTNSKKKKKKSKKDTLSVDDSANQEIMIDTTSTKKPKKKKKKKSVSSGDSATKANNDNEVINAIEDAIKNSSQQELVKPNE